MEKESRSNMKPSGNHGLLNHLKCLTKNYNHSADEIRDSILALFFSFAFKETVIIILTETVNIITSFSYHYHLSQTHSQAVICLQTFPIWRGGKREAEMAKLLLHIF